MATIDVGNGATNQSLIFGGGTTVVDLNNPANDTGTLDTFEIFTGYDGTNLKMGTFSGSGSNYTSRDYESIGNVTGGSKQTFTGKNCDVSTGDFLGYYCSVYAKRLSSGGSGVYREIGDKFGAGLVTYTYNDADDAHSIYATGATSGGATVKPHYYYLQQ